MAVRCSKLNVRDLGSCLALRTDRAEPPAVGAASSAVAVHATSPAWLVIERKVSKPCVP